MTTNSVVILKNIIYHLINVYDLFSIKLSRITNTQSKDYCFLFSFKVNRDQNEGGGKP